MSSYDSDSEMDTRTAQAKAATTPDSLTDQISQLANAVSQLMQQNQYFSKDISEIRNFQLQQGT
ncbi:UNVERIFIED_CONTAM: hypothetical protein HDU68_000178, partial [Siphonaria sp. JEL0065]